MNYYNEFDPQAAQWLRNLIAAGHLPAGDVDERSIEDVKPADLRGYEQCHFFAGIGGWPLALRLAGFHGRVWTGSCPCQPFSAAGKGAGFDDQRHLWPAWLHLIRECRPELVFGEQVAAAVGFGWLDLVQADMEGQGYRVGAAVLGAHSVGAPHIRQRLWWVADSAQCGRGQERENARRGHAGDGPEGRATRFELRGGIGELADSGGAGHRQQREDYNLGAEMAVGSQAGDFAHAAGCGSLGELGHSISAGLEGHAGHGDNGHEPGRIDAQPDGSIAAPSFWSDCDWLPCRDGKARPVESGLEPLAHGIPARVVRLRAYGNAIVPAAGAAFVRAYLGLIEAREVAA